MPPINGTTASFTRDERRARDTGGHQPVIVSGKFKANDGVYPVGQTLKRDADGITWIRSASGDAHKGVCDTTVDTAVDAGGPVVIHGGVHQAYLTVGAAGDAPDQDDILELQAAGIFPQ